MNEDEILLTQVELAFSERLKPRIVVDVSGAVDEIRGDSMTLAKFSREQLTCDLLNGCQDAMYGLSPEGFCYYLPGVINISINDGCQDSIVVASVVQMLDRGAEPALWGDFFSERWRLLSPAELRVVQFWILWLTRFRSFDEITLNRAFDVLEILILEKEGGVVRQ